MGRSTYAFIRHRTVLWLKDRRCHWCRTETVLVCVWPKGVHKLPKNAATLDHKYSKLDPRRKNKGAKSLADTVLSCHKCNEDRARIQRRPVHLLKEQRISVRRMLLLLEDWRMRVESMNEENMQQATEMQV